MKEVWSMLKLFKSGKIYWIKSLPTLKLRVLEDMQEENILKAQMRKNKGRGSRFYFDPDNVEAYVKNWEDKHGK